MFVTVNGNWLYFTNFLLHFHTLWFDHLCFQHIAWKLLWTVSTKVYKLNSNLDIFVIDNPSQIAESKFCISKHFLHQNYIVILSSCSWLILDLKSCNVTAHTNLVNDLLAGIKLIYVCVWILYFIEVLIIWWFLFKCINENAVIVVGEKPFMFLGNKGGFIWKWIIPIS